MGWKQCNLHISARVFVLLADHMMLAQQRLPLSGSSRTLENYTTYTHMLHAKVLCK